MTFTTTFAAPAIDDRDFRSFSFRVLPDAHRLEAKLGKILDDLLVTRWLPATWVERLWRRTDLPEPLCAFVRRLPQGAVWRAYTDRARIWFAVAYACETGSAEARASTVEVSFGAEGYRVHDTAAWEYSRERLWLLV